MCVGSIEVMTLVIDLNVIAVYYVKVVYMDIV